MKLNCYLVENAQIDIRPAAKKRAWMDDTPGASAYRCLPLTIANTHGWELHCTESFEAVWNGGPKQKDVVVYTEEDRKAYASGHFGSGILTFHIKAIFRTSPGYNLWIAGPSNRFKDGIQPLNGVVEADWIPFPFTMNWKFTRPDFRVRFEKGEPFCLIFPVKRGLLESVEPAILDLKSDKDLEEQYTVGYQRRIMVSVIEKIKGEVKDQHLFQKWYLRGKTPDEKKTFADHQKILQLKPFTPLEAPEDLG